MMSLLTVMIILLMKMVVLVLFLILLLSIILHFSGLLYFINSSVFTTFGVFLGSTLFVFVDLDFVMLLRLSTFSIFKIFSVFWREHFCCFLCVGFSVLFPVFDDILFFGTFAVYSLGPCWCCHFCKYEY